MDKKTILTAVGLAAVLPLTMAAKPAELPDSSQGNGYGLGCHYNRTGEDYASPGAFFQAVREEEGLNPKQATDARPNPDTVGDWIDRRCG